MTGENRERRWDATVGERANGCAVDAGASGDCGRCGGRCGDGWRAVVVMEDDTLASGCPAAPVAVEALATVDWWMLDMMRTLRSTKT